MFNELHFWHRIDTILKEEGISRGFLFFAPLVFNKIYGDKKFNLQQQAS